MATYDNQWAGEVQDNKEELKKLNKPFLLDDCDYYTAGGTNKLHCFDRVSFEDTIFSESLLEDFGEEFGLFNDESEESFENIDGIAQIELREFQEESGSE